jgi:hypothetical protein
MIVLLAAAALLGCGGGADSTQTSTLKMYSTGTKLGQRGATPIDPVEPSGPLAIELEHFLTSNYKSESWYPDLEDVWSWSGMVHVATGLDGSSRSKKAAEEVCAVVRNAKVKHPIKSILVGYGYNEFSEC